MAKYPLRLKPILEAAILGVLEGLTEQPIAKGAGKFLVELSNRMSDEPEENQAVIRNASDKEVNDTLTEILEGLDGTYSEAALAAQGVERLEDCVASVRATLRDSLGRIETKLDATHTTITRVDRVVNEIHGRARPRLKQRTSPLNMAEAPPSDFVARPDEFESLVTNLLKQDRQAPTAITAALSGAGGYGKTTLAKAVCHDPRIRRTFSDGILWVTLGQKPSEADLIGKLTMLYDRLTGDRPGFVSVEDGATALADALGEHNCLLVIDDVWASGDLAPFLRGGPKCARLITTRIDTTLPDYARKVPVSKMKENEPVELLLQGLPLGNAVRLRALADRVCNWPLLLGFVKVALRRWAAAYRDEPDKAIAKVERILDERGITAFDDRDPQQRERAVSLTIGVSLELLTAGESAHYAKLAIFPEDADIPVKVLERLWGAAGGMNMLGVELLCERLFELSLLSHFDAKAGFVRLHDVVLLYLQQEHSARLPGIHRQLLDTYIPPAQEEENRASKWARLPAEETYLWRHLSYHLSAAGRVPELRELLFDYGWLLAKLRMTEVTALVADFDGVPDDEALAHVQGAIRLSSTALAKGDTPLAGQLFARLLGDANPEIAALLSGARDLQQGAWLRPIRACLTPPGGPLIRTLEGHTASVYAVAISPDGRQAVSAGCDETLKVWDMRSGKQLRTLKGHRGCVLAVAISPDGRYVVSGAEDDTLKVWDMRSGEELRTLEGHGNSVHAVAISRDGRYVVSGASDDTLKVWGMQSGEELRTLEGHRSPVCAVAISRDGRYIVSGARDATLKVWGMPSGEELRTLEGHGGCVHAVAISPDGRCVISGAGDTTLKVWDMQSGEELRTLEGHESAVWAVAISPDGRYVVSGADTLKVWDMRSREELRTLEGHTSPVRAVAISPDGRYAFSAAEDDSLMVWDTQTGKVIRTLEGPTGWAFAKAISPDGRYAVTAFFDETLKVWDTQSGEKLCTLEGRRRDVYAVAISPNGRYVVSATTGDTIEVWDSQSGEKLCTLDGQRGGVHAVAISSDGKCAVSAGYDETLKMWDMRSGEELRTLEGHRGEVLAVAISPNGRYLVSGAEDRTLKVWDLKDGSLVATFEGEAHYWAMQTAKTTSGLLIVANDGLGRLHFLQMEGL